MAFSRSWLGRLGVQLLAPGSGGRRRKAGREWEVGTQEEGNPGRAPEARIAAISEGTGNQIESICSEDWTRILHFVNQTTFMFLVFSVLISLIFLP